jgi:hypothetical protein
MNKLVELLSKYLLIPVLEKLGKWIYKEAQLLFVRYKQNKKRKQRLALISAIEKAKTDEERKDLSIKLANNSKQ